MASTAAAALAHAESDPAAAQAAKFAREAPPPPWPFAQSVSPDAPRRGWLPWRARSVLRYAAPYAGRHRKGMAVVLLVDALDIAWPFFMAAAIDSVALGADGWTGAISPDGWSVTQRVLAFSGLMVACVALAGYLRYHMIQLYFATAACISRDIRGRLHEHLTKLPRHYFTRTNTGEVMSRLTNDIEAVQFFLGVGRLLIIDAVAYLVLVPIPMLFFSPSLTLVVACLLPLIPFLVYRMSRAVHHRFERVQEQFSTLSDRAHESIAGIKVVKSFVREEAEAERFRGESLEYRRRFVHMAKVDALFQPVFLTIAGLGFFLILAVGGQQVLAGTLTIGAFAAFFAYVIKLTDPMIEVGWTVSLYQRATASDRRITEVLTTEPEIVSPADGGLAPADDTFAGEIEFRGLTFRYPTPPPHALADAAAAKDRAGAAAYERARESVAEAGPGPVVLRELDLRVPAGSTVAIMGEVGSGKSTLLSLVPRLADPPPGTVRLDGRDVRAYNLDWLRRQVGYVPQDTFLFSASIAENIALGRPEATRAEVEAAARIAGVERDITEFPDGYETMLGERGVNLSGGQKQRVAIARAILKRPRILLLDDCLSAVDSVTEETILAGLRGVMRRCTTLIVSHRVSTTMDADLIVMLEAGRIVESGTHDELMRLDGHYARLYRMQQGEADAG